MVWLANHGEAYGLGLLDGYFCFGRFSGGWLLLFCCLLLMVAQIIQFVR